MARSNWGTKSNQEYTLAIKINRIHWDYALSLGVLTHPDKQVYKSGLDWEQDFKQAKIHIQWDPERSIRNTKLEERTIQVGISRQLIEAYNKEWIHQITDYTPLVKKINKLRKEGKMKEAKRLLPKEKLYPISDSVKNRINSH